MSPTLRRFAILAALAILILLLTLTLHAAAAQRRIRKQARLKRCCSTLRIMIALPLVCLRFSGILRWPFAPRCTR